MNNKIIGKVLCDDELMGSVFLITNEFAITANHVVAKKNKDGTININFNKIGQVSRAEKIYSNEAIDISILKLKKAIDIDIGYYTISNNIIEPEDKFETEGFPLFKEGESEFLRGDVNRIVDDKSWDCELNIINQQDDTDWEGMSGSPIIIDNEIVAVVTDEEGGQQKTKLQCITVEKIKDILIEEKQFEMLKLFNNKFNSILVERIDCLNQEFKELFNSYSKVVNDQLSINSYFLKFNDKSEFMVKELCEWVFKSLRDYVSKLNQIKKLREGSFREIRDTQFEIDKLINKTIKQLNMDGEFENILIWLLVEGALKIPRLLSAICTEKNIQKDVFVDFKENQIVMLLGYGYIKEMLEEALNMCINKINMMSYENNNVSLKKEILIWDEIAIDSTGIIEQKLIKENLMRENKKWENVDVKLVMLTGYESNIFNDIEKFRVDKSSLNSIIQSKFINELETHKEKIKEILKGNVNNISINWFVLPFNDISEFKKIVLKNIN